MSDINAIRMLFCSDIVTTKWKKIEIEGDRPTKQTKRGVVRVSGRQKTRWKRQFRSRASRNVNIHFLCVRVLQRSFPRSVPTLLVAVQFSSSLGRHGEGGRDTSSPSEARNRLTHLDFGQILFAIKISML